MPWDEARVELLKKMWGDGFSASNIARELGGVSRNAVIGKVHRLGIASREKAASEAKANKINGDNTDNGADHNDGDHNGVNGHNTDDNSGSVNDNHANGKHVNCETQQTSKNQLDNDVVSKNETAKNKGINSEQDVATVAVGNNAVAAMAVRDDKPNGQMMTIVNNDEASVVAMYQRLSIFELTETTCKWPVGDPNTADFFFCGQSVDGVGPYCSHHAKIAYQNQATRKPKGSH